MLTEVEGRLALVPKAGGVQVGNEKGCWTPQTAEDRGAVRAQLDRILDTHQFRISRRYPNLLRYGVDMNAPLAGFTEDFGIIMRHFDPTTQQYLVVASGIAYYGTLASGEFLTDPKLMGLLAARAPAGWYKKNLEAVFSTRIPDGETGQPQILATHFW